MIGWLNLTAEQRRTTLDQAAVRSGITTKALEKDWWVTLTLKTLFQTPYASHFTFKGGTSLSKGYKLIQRFSEDIDIALAPAAFGRMYQPNPTYSYVKRLKKEGCQFTTIQVKDALAKSLSELGLEPDIAAVIAAPVDRSLPDKDPQTLYLHYPSLYAPHHYLKDEVKIEFSIKSLSEPYEQVLIQSLLWEYFPNKAYEELPASIRTTLPVKTFLEKMFLLHEKFSGNDRPGITNETISLERGSRHLYDLVKMMEHGIADAVLADPNFYAASLLHRKHWIRLKGIDYNTLLPGTLNFIPPAAIIEKYRADYNMMLKEMIYAPYHNFEVLVEKLHSLNHRFKKMPQPLQIIFPRL
ncbi:nucleotidyl transferase AbiEii/AbiGii toxin family protein [Chitinophaga sp. 22321]|uniref:Nucleotidyl transferase AbiEii/AbiGii toxin family protein n=1 Tax=Chitinophaga hostae TaxID=2831022 RepID=A0ABS5IZI2_9BACT|nr:nucleotidyl transferase AbiEii/AbiGii toxin family protein [Chitinophaga hostae]MBS0027582.1 nucleotidyl transferase AbiEii/AbiGii toxin family protein [Chitinophaga hostae]